MIDKRSLCGVLNAVSIQTSVRDANGYWYVRLKETDPSASLKQVDLYGVSPDAVAVKLDAGRPLTDLLASEGGLRQRCDYLIVTECNGKQILLYVDLKSGKVPSDVKNQFKGGVCLVKYLGAVLEQFQGKANFFTHFESRFVAFYKPPHPPKGTSRQAAVSRNAKIDHFLKVPNPFRPWVSQLIG